jgi:hypothetical protein
LLVIAIVIDMGRKSASAASRQAVADWLKQAIGVGSTFTMLELRDAVPDANQVDRRMRELREVGWVIDTNRTDPNLPPGKYRLTRIGDGTKVRGVVSARLRRQVFERDQYRCRICGYAAGEEYVDEPGKICRLTVGHLQAGNQGGADDITNYRTECARDNETVRDRTATPPSVVEIVIQARNLTTVQKRQLAAWLGAEKREFSPVEDLWARLLALTPEYKQAVLDELRNFAS